MDCKVLSGHYCFVSVYRTYAGLSCGSNSQFPLLLLCMCMHICVGEEENLQKALHPLGMYSVSIDERISSPLHQYLFISFMNS